MTHTQKYQGPRSSVLKRRKTDDKAQRPTAKQEIAELEKQGENLVCSLSRVAEYVHIKRARGDVEIRRARAGRGDAVVKLDSWMVDELMTRGLRPEYVKGSKYDASYPYAVEDTNARKPVAPLHRMVCQIACEVSRALLSDHMMKCIYAGKPIDAPTLMHWRHLGILEARLSDGARFIIHHQNERKEDARLRNLAVLSIALHAHHHSQVDHEHERDTKLDKKLKNQVGWWAPTPPKLLNSYHRPDKKP